MKGGIGNEEMGIEPRMTRSDTGWEEGRIENGLKLRSTSVGLIF